MQTGPWLQRAESKRNPVPFSLWKPNQECPRGWEIEEMIPDWPGKKDFTYKLNNFGLRYDTQDKPKKICFVGCSHTFGHGLPQDYVYPEIITKSLGDEWQCINVSIPGSGPDVQCINLAWAIDKYDIDVVVWYMSTPLRQIHIKDTMVHMYVPPKAVFYNGSERKRFQQVMIDCEDTIYTHTYWQMYSIFQLLHTKGIKTYFRCWDGKMHIDLFDSGLMKRFNITEIPNLKDLDVARDGQHRGQKSHQHFAESILGVMNGI